jgi:transposase
MSKSMRRPKAVPKAASENGQKSSSQEAAFGTLTLATSEQPSLNATRAHDRLAAGRAAEQTDRFASRGSTSSPSKDRCFVPGLSRTTARALSSHYKKEKTMPAPAEPQYVGLDIAKDQLDYCFSDTVEGHLANTAAERASFIQRLRALEGARVVCEASGGYEKIIVAELLAAGIEVCVVQPGRVRAFAQAEGLLAKTDRLDARLLRRYGQKIALRLTEPINQAAATLRELLEHRRQLTTQLCEVDNRLDLAGATLHQLLRRQQAFLQKQIAQVEKMIKEHIDGDPGLRTKAERLQQIKGVGPVLSATILAYVPELGRIEAAQLSALIGVAPHPRDSGATRFPRHVRGGRAQVRHVLYMAAVCAARANPILAAFYQRLRANGKPAKVCLVAVMRKLVCLMNHLIQDPHFALAK